MKVVSEPRRVALWGLVALAICVIFAAVGLYLQHKTDVRPSLLYRDANAIAENPFYYGIFESMTASIMIASGSVLVFTCIVETGIHADVRAFSLVIGILTLAMGFDDLLMLHESMWFFYWRLQESHVYAGYAALTLIGTVYYWRVFFSTSFPLFGVALGALALAAAGDQLGVWLGPEDYLEILGFSFWFSYAIATSISIKRGLLPIGLKAYPADRS